MKILTATEMGTADRRTAEEFGISIEALMEHAGAAVAAFCLRQYPAATRVTVLCGKGNNGGDGLVAARLLTLAGRTVEVILLGTLDAPKGEAATALKRLREEAPATLIHEAPDEAALKNIEPIISGAELLIDALVGTGFKPPLRGLALSLRDLGKELQTPIVAVDLPSGWDADSMEQTVEGAFRADAVVAFTAPKMAHVFGQLTTAVLGAVVIADIGSPSEAVQSETRLTWSGASKAIAERPRGANSNKGKFGHVLVLGGSFGKAGAPAMASLAALRTGAGLVTAAVPHSIVNTVATIAPELMTVPLSEDKDGIVSLKNFDADTLQELVNRITALAIGPGLSTKGDASELARRIVEKTTLPVVIDADALNAFAGRTDLLHGTGRTMVLTPHPGEMARLAGMTVKQVEADRIGLARSFATRHKLTLVLKGWRTLIAHPDGSIAINTTGNPAMSKGGSGDILTGIVAGMLAQFPNDVARAVETAVYLHGLAADFAARAMDEHTVLATDTVTHLTDAFRYRVKDKDGLTWICGLHS